MALGTLPAPHFVYNFALEAFMFSFWLYLKMPQPYAQGRDKNL
jgi:hypothetical protein